MQYRVVGRFVGSQLCLRNVLGGRRGVGYSGASRLVVWADLLERIDENMNVIIMRYT